MLYTQIPRKIVESIAARLTIDLKLVKTEFSEIPPQETLIYKLRLVEEHIMINRSVGPVKDKQSYIKDTMYMKWGQLTNEMVYFSGYKEDSILGLGGSLKHVIGNVGVTVIHGHSTTPYIVAALKNEVIKGELWEYSGRDFESSVLSAVEFVSLEMEGLEEKLSFLAKSLVHGKKEDSDQRIIVLGSPIYVALED